MNKTEYVKRLILPLVLTIAVCCGFFLFISTADEIFPFDNHIDMAYHSDTQVKDAQTVLTDGDTVAIDRIGTYDSNTLLGELSYNDNKVNIIYDGSDVNITQASTLNADGKIIGQVGCAFIYGYRVNMQNVMQMAVGDVITITMPYGTYQYQCINKAVVQSEWQVLSGNYDVSRGLVIYSDNSTGVGVTGSYDVVVFEMVSGAKVIG